MTSATATHKATIHTNHGDIVVELFGNHAPKTVKNFVGLSDGTQEWADPRTGEKQSGPLYKDVVFHRIIKDFMIQGGDPLGQGIGGPGYNFDDEIHPELNFNAPYMLAMANAGTRNGHRPHHLAAGQAHHLRRGGGRRLQEGRGRAQHRPHRRPGPPRGGLRDHLHRRGSSLSPTREHTAWSPPGHRVGSTSIRGR